MREKQIEEMKKCRAINEMELAIRNETAACQTCAWYKNGVCDDSCELAEDNQKICTDLYNAGYRKQSEWISVDERLPELKEDVRTWGDLKIQPSVRVLCACKQKSGKVFVKEGYCEMWGSGVVWKIPGSVDSVTHWMPLPEPPKMKGGEEQ